MSLTLILGLLAVIASIAIGRRTGTGSLSERLAFLAVSLRLDAGERDIDLPSASELRTRCQEAAEKVIGLRTVPEDKRPDTWAADLRSTIDELHDYDLLETVATKNERAAVEQLAWDNAVRAAEAERARAAKRGVRGPSAAFSEGDDEQRSAGWAFVDSDGYAPGNFRAPEVEVRNLLTGGSAGGTGSDNFVPVGSPTWNAAAARRMRPFLRDLIAVTGTNLASIPYIRELSAATYETGAAMVKEASAKPEVTMLFERDDAPVRKIAAWIQITEEAYNDAPTLRGYIDTRLAYMLQVREEAELIAGTGTSPSIKGITSFSGVQTQTAVTDDLAGTIGLAISKIENVDGFADGVAINPITYWTGTVKRHSTWMDGGMGAGTSGLPFSAPPQGILGLPTVRTRALAVNKALVGCYSIGAQIFERQGTTIKSTDSHASLFISNTLVVLAEQREALAVHRPDFFVDTTLSFT